MAKRVRSKESPTQWAHRMSDSELLDYMTGCMDAVLPRAVAQEIRYRFLSKKDLIDQLYNDLEFYDDE